MAKLLKAIQAVKAANDAFDGISEAIKPAAKAVRIFVHISMPITYRLRPEDGSYIYIAWYWPHLWPEAYYDKACNRPIEGWEYNLLICDAINKLHLKLKGAVS